MNKKNIKDFFKVVSIPAFVASLCCLSPIILVLLGISTVSFASSLSDIFYGTYKWWFRLAGFLTLVISLVYYFRRRRGICTIDDFKRRKNEIINFVALSVVVFVLSYIIFLYVIVHYLGAFLKIWSY
jgi:hypothetical protein